MACNLLQVQNEQTQECETSWLVWLFLWTFVNVSPMWWVIYANKRSAPNAERDKEYGAFVRRDYHNWSYA